MLTKALWILLVSLVIAHLTLVVTNIASLFVLIAVAPWYIAAPCCSFIVWVTFTRMGCPLTVLENELRSQLGVPRISGFIGHYVVGPLRKRNIKKWIGSQ
jgi:hypothetical protein